MELKEIVDIIANNSIGLVCLAVMILCLQLKKRRF